MTPSSSKAQGPEKDDTFFRNVGCVAVRTSKVARKVEVRMHSKGRQVLGPAFCTVLYTLLSPCHEYVDVVLYLTSLTIIYE